MLQKPLTFCRVFTGVMDRYSNVIGPIVYNVIDPILSFLQVLWLISTMQWQSVPFS